jgi:hypothetical protein
VLTRAIGAFGMTRLATLGGLQFFKVFFQGDMIALRWYKKKPKNLHQVLQLDVMFLSQWLLLDMQQKQ